MTAQSLADEFADLLKDHSEVNSDDIAELYEIHHSIEAVIGLLFVQNATTVLTALRESGEAIERAAKLEAALKPFADEARYYDPSDQDGKVLHDDHVTDDGNGIRVGDFRAARRALKPEPSR